MQSSRSINVTEFINGHRLAPFQILIVVAVGTGGSALSHWSRTRRRHAQFGDAHIGVLSGQASLFLGDDDVLRLHRRLGARRTGFGSLGRKLRMALGACSRWHPAASAVAADGVEAP